jgi:hypothetical protein
MISKIECLTFDRFNIKCKINTNQNFDNSFVYFKVIKLLLFTIYNTSEVINDNLQLDAIIR